MIITLEFWKYTNLKIKIQRIIGTNGQNQRTNSEAIPNCHNLLKKLYDKILKSK